MAIKNNKKISKILSIFIISIFSGLIVGGSGWTLKTVSDYETNWAFLERIYGFRPVVATTENTPKLTLVESIKLDNNSDCLDNSYEGVSLVNYLKAQGQESSFNSRIVLAKKFNISNYVGSSQQNLTILRHLKSQNENCQLVVNKF